MLITPAIKYIQNRSCCVEACAEPAEAYERSWFDRLTTNGCLYAYLIAGLIKVTKAEGEIYHLLDRGNITGTEPSLFSFCLGLIL
jgi:hypothetical protein